MISISNFFRKFIDIQKNNDQVFLNIINTIKKFTGVDIDKSQIEIKGDNLYLKIKPSIKNAIFMNKENIESALKLQKIFLRIR